ncbi:MAG: chromosomal replication initiator protein DnaA [Syntrophomonadaceae bacterium]|nr:chromosomal replication initiator protein DnaA [Syntrophomonadaceae bacterium]
MLKDYSIVWDTALTTVRQEIGPTSFEIWFSSVLYQDFVDNHYVASVPNLLFKEWIESRYLSILESVLSDLHRQDITVRLVLRSQGNTDDFRIILNPKYTFDTFVVGNSNRFAHAACYAVAEAPARSYNPLFIYGGVGLGKTHLMQAIGHHILGKNSSYNIMYVSSEQFTNDLINSIRDDKTSEFRNKYRNIDLLLIDDIQFLAGKERTQEEFFHTFNALYEANKQLVISSDRPPREIPTLEDRLRSRFEWGLITDIQPPDLETRVAILRKKAQLEHFAVPDDVILYIADYIQANIRELEGALIRTVAYANISGQPVTLDLATETLKDVLPPPGPRTITIQAIKETVAEYFGIKVEELDSKRRTRHLVFPRQIAMYLAREMTQSSLPQIGEEFGGRDHTTALHAYEKIASNLKTDSSLHRIILEIAKKIDPNYTVDS